MSTSQRTCASFLSAVSLLWIEDISLQGCQSGTYYEHCIYFDNWFLKNGIHLTNVSPAMLPTLTHIVNQILAATSHKPYIADYRACTSNSSPIKSVYGFWPLDFCSPVILLPMTQLFWHFSTHSPKDIATVELDSTVFSELWSPPCAVSLFLGQPLHASKS